MKGKILTKAKKLDSAHPAEQAETATRVKRADHADAEHEDVDDEDDRGDWGVAAKEFGEAFAPRGKREAQAGAAFVTAVGVDADERAARGAKLWAFFAGAAKHAAKDLLPPRQAQLPMIGKGQPSSLRASNCIPIIPEMRRAIRRRGPMDKFEEFGRKLDEEITRLRKYLDEEVAPTTEKRTAQFLREVSDKLSDAAKKLEDRVAARTPQEPKP
jgi:hypothetical protein